MNFDDVTLPWSTAGAIKSELFVLSHCLARAIHSKSGPEEKLSGKFVFVNVKIEILVAPFVVYRLPLFLSGRQQNAFCVAVLFLNTTGFFLALSEVVSTCLSVAIGSTGRPHVCYCFLYACLVFPSHPQMFSLSFRSTGFVFFCHSMHPTTPLLVAMQLTTAPVVRPAAPATGGSQFMWGTRGPTGEGRMVRRHRWLPQKTEEMEPYGVTSAEIWLPHSSGHKPDRAIPRMPVYLLFVPRAHSEAPGGSDAISVDRSCYVSALRQRSSPEIIEPDFLPLTTLKCEFEYTRSFHCISINQPLYVVLPPSQRSPNKMSRTAFCDVSFLPKPSSLYTICITVGGWFVVAIRTQISSSRPCICLINNRPLFSIMSLISIVCSKWYNVDNSIPSATEIPPVCVARYSIPCKQILRFCHTQTMYSPAPRSYRFCVVFCTYFYQSIVIPYPVPYTREYNSSRDMGYPYEGDRRRGPGNGTGIYLCPVALNFYSRSPEVTQSVLKNLGVFAKTRKFFTFRAKTLTSTSEVDKIFYVRDQNQNITKAVDLERESRNWLIFCIRTPLRPLLSICFEFLCGRHFVFEDLKLFELNPVNFSTSRISFEAQKGVVCGTDSFTNPVALNCLQNKPLVRKNPLIKSTKVCMYRTEVGNILCVRDGRLFVFEDIQVFEVNSAYSLTPYTSFEAQKGEVSGTGSFTSPAALKSLKNYPPVQSHTSNNPCSFARKNLNLRAKTVKALYTIKTKSIRAHPPPSTAYDQKTNTLSIFGQLGADPHEKSRFYKFSFLCTHKLRCGKNLYIEVKFSKNFTVDLHSSVEMGEASAGPDGHGDSKRPLCHSNPVQTGSPTNLRPFSIAMTSNSSKSLLKCPVLSNMICLRGFFQKLKVCEAANSVFTKVSKEIFTEMPHIPDYVNEIAYCLPHRSSDEPLLLVSTYTTRLSHDNQSILGPKLPKINMEKPALGNRRCPRARKRNFRNTNVLVDPHHHHRVADETLSQETRPELTPTSPLRTDMVDSLPPVVELTYRLRLIVENLRETRQRRKFDCLAVVFNLPSVNASESRRRAYKRRLDDSTVVEHRIVGFNEDQSFTYPSVASQSYDNG